MAIGTGTALLIGAGVGAASSYLSSKEASKGAESAARIGAGATDRATELQSKIYEEQRPYLEKIRSADIQAIEGYQGLLNDPSKYTKTPGYLFRLQEGLKAIGIPDGGNKYLSGSQIKAATQYAEDYATSDYERALARYGRLIGVGQGAVQAGQQYASTAGNLMLQGGNIAAQGAQNAANARASGYIGMGNAANQGIQNYMLYNMWKDK